MPLIVPNSALVVDDEAHVRLFIKLILNGLGVKQVYEAASVTEARAAWNEHLPDFLILDINMPGETGLDFLKELRLVDDEVPVVIMSANAQLAIIKQAAEVGADGFIRKDSPRETIIAELTLVMTADDEES